MNICHNSSRLALVYLTISPRGRAITNLRLAEDIDELTENETRQIDGRPRRNIFHVRYEDQCRKNEVDDKLAVSHSQQIWH